MTRRVIASGTAEKKGHTPEPGSCPQLVSASQRERHHACETIDDKRHERHLPLSSHAFTGVLVQVGSASLIVRGMVHPLHFALCRERGCAFLLYLLCLGLWFFWEGPRDSLQRIAESDEPECSGQLSVSDAGH